MTKIKKEAGIGPFKKKHWQTVEIGRPWFRLRLPSCGTWFESQANHLGFLQFILLKIETIIVIAMRNEDWPIS